MKSLPGLDPDGKKIVTSDDVLQMTTLPKDIVIVGAGAVGVEFASMFHDIGVKVTLLEYAPQIVPLEDAEVGKVVQRSFEKRGMTVMTNARFDPAAVSTDKDGICLMVGPEGKEPQELRAEMMLVATGRAANIEEIGLETTKVETDKGVIKVNGRMRTKEPHVYAIGDIIGGLWLAHTAAHEGLIAAHVIAGEADVHEMDYTKQPRATYCRPEIASIGLTEEQVKARGHAVQGRQGPVPGHRQGDHRRRVRGLREGHREHGEPGHPRRPHRRTARHGPHRRGVARLRARRDRRGRSAARPTPTRPCPRSSARRRWRSTAGPSTSDGGPSTTMAVTKSDAAKGEAAASTAADGEAAGSLAASVGLTDADLVEMYRYVALARALDERMWILNRAGRIPFVISRPGPRGRPGRDRLGVQARSRLDRPVLSLDRDVPDLRDEPARHPDRAVRDRQRPVARAGARCPATTARTSTTS